MVRLYTPVVLPSTSCRSIDAGILVSCRMCSPQRMDQHYTTCTVLENTKFNRTRNNAFKKQSSRFTGIPKRFLLMNVDFYRYRRSEFYLLAVRIIVLCIRTYEQCYQLPGFYPVCASYVLESIAISWAILICCLKCLLVLRNIIALEFIREISFYKGAKDSRVFLI